MLDFDTAHTYFLSVDPVMADLLARSRSNPQRPLRNPSKTAPDDYAHNLYVSIVSQQISTKAADKIFARFLQLVGDTSDPSQILRHDITALRGVGLSGQKASYVLSIADHIANGTIDFAALDTLDEQGVISELTKIKGVGQWTAEMFLMFTLARPDVFSVGDLGLLSATRTLYGNPGLTRQELEQISIIWSPHRTTSALVLWHSLDNKG